VRALQSKILLVTGTDTGVGKTVLTALLLRHLRCRGINALAIKPFCSGNRGDIRLLRAVQENALRPEEVTPFYFPEPLTPWLAAERAGERISLDALLEHVRAASMKCDLLLVEGAGGLLAPLGEGYSLLDVWQKLPCGALIVARNRLGTLNHTMLTVRALQQAARRPMSIALMEQRTKDFSSRLNWRALERLIPEVTICSIPFLGSKIRAFDRIVASEKKLKKQLATLAGSV
jgi:dethiobiotin synthetase